MSTTNYFAITSPNDLTGIAPYIATDFEREVNHRTIGDTTASCVLADAALAVEDTTTNEIQSVTIDAAGGTFTITYAAQTTTAIAFDATAAAVQAALVALSNIASGDVAVAGGPGATNAFIIQFTGTLAHTNVAAVTTTATSLTGGAGTAVVATLQAGGTIAA